MSVIKSNLNQILEVMLVTLMLKNKTESFYPSLAKANVKKKKDSHQLRFTKLNLKMMKLSFLAMINIFLKILTLQFLKARWLLLLESKIISKIKIFYLIFKSKNSVGSGKSSLLYSLIGEMKFDDYYEAKPRVEINGEMAIVH